MLGARAETVVAIPTHPDEKVSIRIASPCLEIPAFGFMPLRVTIVNSAERERTWQGQFTVGSFNGTAGMAAMVVEFAVPPRQTRESWVFVPVAESGELGPAPDITDTGVNFPVRGRAATRARSVPAPTHRGRTMSMTLYVDFSGAGVVGVGRMHFPGLSGSANMRQIAATQAIESIIEPALKGEGIASPTVALVNVNQLPPDWRVWSPYALVYLGRGEYAQLDVARRAALRAWVAAGGVLYLVPETESERTFETCGAGQIISLSKPLATVPSATALVNLDLSLASHAGYPDQDMLRLQPGSTLHGAAERAPSSMKWLIGFVAAFAIIAGPINLYVLAPASKRHRLFVTTPLISLAGVAVLGAAILIQDGMGGEGWRQALVVLIPHQHEAVVVQEQASRTGFVATQAFAIADDVQMTRLPFPNERGQYHSATGQDLLRRDGTASGGWFRSRSSQAQLLQRVVPTRARVERVGVEQNGAPIVLSSFAITLRGFVCVAEDGDLWHADELAPGARVTLSAGGDWIDPRAPGCTERFADLFAQATARRPGCWVAKSSESDLAPIATSHSVRWRTADVLVTGMLEGQTAQPEGAK